MKELKVQNHKDSEKWLEQELAKRVERLGGRALKFSSQTEIGYPDRIILMPDGYVYWVELKSRGKKPRLIQTIRHQELQKLGQDLTVISSIEELDTFTLKIRNNVQNK